MKKKYFNSHSNINENLIINKFLKKLNFNKSGTFNFNNDGAFLKLNKNKKLVITSDTIVENIDFFQNDDPKSIAKKLITVNLSDLSAMGSFPLTYTLSLCLPKNINIIWINKFTQELNRLQKIYNFYLIGGDISESKQITVTATFFGLPKDNIVTSQSKFNLKDDIFVTGNIGDSYVGLMLIKNKIKMKNKKMRNYFLSKYYYPKPCMLGSYISKYVNSMKDISDGFIGDLRKMLSQKAGAKLSLKNIPVSKELNNFCNYYKFNKRNLINVGDNYQLIIISNPRFRKQIISVAQKKNIKISRIGSVIRGNLIKDDSGVVINNNKEYQHFT